MKDARAWVAHLRAHLPLALSGEDPEGVHQVRVAGRRLRVYLDLLGYRVLREDLRRLVRGAGRVRDLEVALTAPPLPEGASLPPGLKAHLERELAQARALLPALLASPWMEALLRALAALPPLERPRAKARLARLEAQTRKRLRDLRQNPTSEALHAYRRALRQLRYAKEFLGLPTKRERALQEVLGGLNDLEVFLGLLADYLAQSPEEEALALREALLVERQARFREALEALGLRPGEAGVEPAS
jgi:CHAD domain-containing protein